MEIKKVKLGKETILLREKDNKEVAVKNQEHLIRHTAKGIKKVLFNGQDEETL